MKWTLYLPGKLVIHCCSCFCCCFCCIWCFLLGRACPLNSTYNICRLSALWACLSRRARATTVAGLRSSVQLLCCKLQNKSLRNPPALGFISRVWGTYSLPAFLPACVPSPPPSFFSPFLLAFLPSWLPSCLPSYLPVFLPFFLFLINYYTIEWSLMLITKYSLSPALLKFQFFCEAGFYCSDRRTQTRIKTALYLLVLHCCT